MKLRELIEVLNSQHHTIEILEDSTNEVVFQGRASDLHYEELEYLIVTTIEPDSGGYYLTVYVDTSKYW